MLKKRFVIVYKLLYKKPDSKHLNPRIVLADLMLIEAFKKYHDEPCGGHLGQEKTYLKINNNCWHPKLFERVKEMCEKCLKCINTKVPRMKTRIKNIINIPEKPMDRIEVDIQGPYKRSAKGNVYIIVATDYLSRFIFTEAEPHAKAPIIIRFLRRLFVDNGTPKIVQTDQGKNFLSEDVENFLIENNVKHVKSTPYHPQTQGLVERSNQTVNERIRLFCNSIHEWDKYLPQLTYSINTSVNKTTKRSPFLLLKGYEPRISLDNRFETISKDIDIEVKRELGRENIENEQNKYLIKGNRMEQETFKSGDFVRIRKIFISNDRGKKLAKRLIGPFLIIDIEEAVVTAVHYSLHKLIKVNIDKLVKFNGTANTKMQLLRYVWRNHQQRFSLQ